MATKKTALAKRAQPALKLATVEQELDLAVKRMALAITNIKDEDQPEALLMVRNVGRAVEDTESVLKHRIVDYLKQHGAQTTSKGSMRANVNGYVLEIQPSRTGYDPKKVEALLRAKGLDPAVGMDAKISYTCNDGKLADAVRSGKLSEDELATCNYEAGYRLITPKKEE